MNLLLKKRNVLLIILILIVIEIYRESSHDSQDFSYYAKHIAGNIWLEPYIDHGPTGDSMIFTSQNFSRIPTNVLDYRTNDTLIVVKQKRIKNYMSPGYPYTKVRDYPNTEDSIYYWLIIVPVDSFIGPLSIDSISILYDLYRIDESLRL